MVQAFSSVLRKRSVPAEWLPGQIPCSLVLFEHGLVISVSGNLSMRSLCGVYSLTRLDESRGTFPPGRRSSLRCSCVRVNIEG